MKNNIEQLMLKCKRGNNIHVHVILNFSQILHLKVQVNMFLFKTCLYTWKNIRKLYNNNKLKIIVRTWSDEFELPDGFYSLSDIQDYTE